MRRFKGLYIPPMSAYIEGIQQEHCNNSVCRTDECEECLFSSDNLEKFTQWYFDGAYQNPENETPKT